MVKIKEKRTVYGQDLLYRYKKIKDRISQHKKVYRWLYINCRVDILIMLFLLPFV